MQPITDEQIARVVAAFDALAAEDAIPGQKSPRWAARWYGSRDAYGGGYMSIRFGIGGAAAAEGVDGVGVTVVEATWNGRRLALRSPFTLGDRARHAAMAALEAAK